MCFVGVTTVAAGGTVDQEHLLAAYVETRPVFHGLSGFDPDDHLHYWRSVVSSSTRPPLDCRSQWGAGSGGGFRAARDAPMEKCGWAAVKGYARQTPPRLSVPLVPLVTIVDDPLSGPVRHTTAWTSAWPLPLVGHDLFPNRHPQQGQNRRCRRPLACAVAARHVKRATHGGGRD